MSVAENEEDHSQDRRVVWRYLRNVETDEKWAEKANNREQSKK